MAKTRVSVTLDSELVADLDDNNINKSKYINELLNKHRITINYIESVAGKGIDINEVVELGLEALKDKADKQRDLANFTAAMSKPQVEPKRVSRDKAVELLVTECSTYDQLAELVESEYGYQVDNVTPPNAPVIASNKYHYENLFVQRATNGQYSVSRSGEIIN